MIFGSRYAGMDQVKFVKAVFHKFYMGHSWIPWPFLVAVILSWSGLVVHGIFKPDVSKFKNELMN